MDRAIAAAPTRLRARRLGALGRLFLWLCAPFFRRISLDAGAAEMLSGPVVYVLRAFSRLERRQQANQLAKQHGKRFNLYSFRHSYITESLVSGLDAVTVSVLAGHIAYYGGYFGLPSLPGAVDVPEVVCFIAAAVAAYGGARFIDTLRDVLLVLLGVNRGESKR